MPNSYRYRTGQKSHLKELKTLKPVLILLLPRVCKWSESSPVVENKNSFWETKKTIVVVALFGRWRPHYHGLKLNININYWGSLSILYCINTIPKIYDKFMINILYHQSYGIKNMIHHWNCIAIILIWQKTNKHQAAFKYSKQTLNVLPSWTLISTSAV